MGNDGSVRISLKASGTLVGKSKAKPLGRQQKAVAHIREQRLKGKSVAVGSRSILTHVHVAAGTDIAVECFARALYNHGVMAVVEV